MRILFLSRWFPYPPNNGSKLRIYNLLRGLSQHHQITLLSFADEPTADPNVPELRRICHDVQTVPWKPFDPQSRQARWAFLSITPRSYVDTYSPSMSKHVERALSTCDYDLVIASQLDMAQYGRMLRKTPALLEEVEVALLYEQVAQATSSRQRARRHLTWLKHRRYLAGVLQNFRACTVVSERERQLLQRTVPGSGLVEVVPNGIDVADYEVTGAEPQPNSLIYTGSFRYAANHDAMIWFLEAVWPRIQARIPEASLTITGDHAGLSLPPANNVTLAGFVPDVRPLIASSWVSVAPLRVGGGTRLKILEAMALGTPVVATSKGTEGLEALNGMHLLVADTPEDFAAAVVRLLCEPELRLRLAENAYQLVSNKYDWKGIMPRFLSLVEQVAQQPSAGPRH